MKRLLLLSLLSLMASGICGLLRPPGAVLAGTGEVVFVEALVDLASDGSAVVAYTVQWEVVSGDLHGFYFEEQDNLRIGTVSTDSYALDSEGRRYPDFRSFVLGGGRLKREVYTTICGPASFGAGAIGASAGGWLGPWSAGQRSACGPSHPCGGGIS